MKTFYMKEVLVDYYGGMIVVRATDPDHAWEVLRAHCEQKGELYVYNWAKEDGGEWQELADGGVASSASPPASLPSSRSNLEGRGNFPPSTTVGFLP